MIDCADFRVGFLTSRDQASLHIRYGTGIEGFRINQLADSPERVDPRHLSRARLECDTDDRIDRLTSNQLELRIEPHPHVGVAQAMNQFFDRLAIGPLLDQLVCFLAQSDLPGGGVIELDHAPGVPELESAFAPFAPVERAIGAESKPRTLHAPAHDLIIGEREVSPLRLDRETANGRFGKFIDEEMSGETLIEASLTGVLEAARAVGVVGQGRRDVGRLSGKMGHPQFLRHPDVVSVTPLGGWDGDVEIFRSILPVKSPAGVAPFGDVNQPFALDGKIAVVIDAEQIAEFVESNLERVAQAVCEHFQVAPVGIAAKARSTKRVGKLTAVRSRDIQRLVANREIDFPVRTDR